MKKILIIKGSPRREGNTNFLADKCKERIEKIGGKTITYTLNEMDIKPCQGCRFCEKVGTCVINDDMAKIYDEILSCDGMIIATPIYWFNMSAQTKLFIDRLYAILLGKGKEAFENIKIGIIMAYAASDPYTSGAVNALRSFQDMWSYLGIEAVDYVYCRAFEKNDVSKDIYTINKVISLGENILK